jgi:predicted AAA+ superfamily ATPase
VYAIAESDIRLRIERDNPWWADPAAVIPEASYPRRVYFEPLRNLALDQNIRRATVLLGPRRVGKTVMAKQLIAEAIRGGFDPKAILYASIDAPVYSHMLLENFLRLMPTAPTSTGLVIFDEIQYLRGWEVHLKDLVDHYTALRFVATGSAAAALRLQSRESGAGRFSDFMLPPLTFYEFLDFLGENDSLIENRAESYIARDMARLNDRFIDYLNFGGYPEAVINENIRNNSEQFIRHDIIDKVLLKDLPSLYGIENIQELNRLFSVLAYNAGREVSLENIAQNSGITKPTIKRYIEYLESAFLIMKVSMVDDNCRTLKRERNFKVYLNNPSMRAGLFAPVEPNDSDLVGHLAESAIFSQWQHAAPSFRQKRYARWRNEGEVDIVFLDGPQNQPRWVGEIKWSDRVENNFMRETRAIGILLRKHRTIKAALFTTKTIEQRRTLEDRQVRLIPSALYCYTVGRNIMARLDQWLGTKDQEGGDE